MLSTEKGCKSHIAGVVNVGRSNSVFLLHIRFESENDFWGNFPILGLREA